MVVQLAVMDGMWCGQGMTHMLRLYPHYNDKPDTTPADMIALFDLGAKGGGLSESKKVLKISPPVKTIIEALELQQKAGKTPRFDLVLISHQDNDHWLLINELVDQVVKRKIPLEVTRIVLGGTNWGKAAKKAVSRLAAYIPGTNKNPIYYTPSATDYGAPLTGVTTTLPLGDVLMRTIIANSPSATSSDALIKNGTSAVVVVELYNQAFLLPGDATYETLGAANALLKKWPHSPLPWIYMISAPHHGSLDTMTKNNIGSKSNLQELVEFVDRTRPFSVFASAGAYSSHKHPYFVILEVLSRYAGSKEYYPHDIVVYDGDNAAWRQIPKEERNIYTTVRDLRAPLGTADWIFDLDTLGLYTTKARFFEAGVRALESVPQSNPTMLAMEISDDDDDDEDDDDDGMLSLSTGAMRRSRPALLAREVLPGLDHGYIVRPAGIFGSRTPVMSGRVQSAPASACTSGAIPLPPNRRVSPQRAEGRP